MSRPTLSHQRVTFVVVTALVLYDRAERAWRGHESTGVEFLEPDDAALRRYVATGEPRDKAGGYAIQGLAAAFVERIEGSYSGVVGLPLFETARLLQDSGISGWLQDAPDHE